MTVIKSSRLKLDRALDDPRNVVLILSADAAGAGKAVHDTADPGFPDEPYRKTFLLEDLGVVKAEDGWGPAIKTSGQYVVWNCAKKAVRKSSQVTELLTSGTPDLLLIREAFASPDPS